MPIPFNFPSTQVLIKDNELLADLYERIIKLSSAAVRIVDGRVVKGNTSKNDVVEFRYPLEFDTNLVTRIMRTFHTYNRVESSLSLVFLCESLGFCVDEESYIIASGLLLDKKEYDLVIELFELFKLRQQVPNKSRYQSAQQDKRKSTQPTLFPPFRRWQSYFGAIVASGEKGDVSKIVSYLQSMKASRVELRMPIIDKAMKGFLIGGLPDTAVLFFRKVFNLPIPKHLAPSHNNDSIQKVVYETDFAMKLTQATDEIVHLALRCCFAAKLGFDALEIIAYSEQRGQDDLRLSNHDTGQSMLNWELVILSIATPENIHLLPQILSILSYMDRPISATRRLFLICLTASVSLGSDASISAVIKSMEASGLKLDDDCISDCIEISRSYFTSELSTQETSLKENHLRHSLLAFLKA